MFGAGGFGGMGAQPGGFDPFAGMGAGMGAGGGVLRK